MRPSIHPFVCLDNLFVLTGRNKQTTANNLYVQIFFARERTAGGSGGLDAYFTQYGNGEASKHAWWLFPVEALAEVATDVSVAELLDLRN